MLADFLRANRDEIVTRTLARTATSAGLSASDDEQAHGIPLFLDQLGDSLRQEASTDAVDHTAIRVSSSRHAIGLLRRGLTVGQVVHCYGDVCQVVTELAIEMGVPILGDEFKTLNLCLDDAIAEAVTEFATRRERRLTDQGAERLGVLAHELRNHINSAMLAFEIIKSGRVAAGGSTGLVLDRSLVRLRDLVDRSLAEVRLEAGIERFERIEVSVFLQEVEISAAIQAQARGIALRIAPVELGVTIAGDSQILVAAVSNLLHNAMKFTPKRGHVALTTRVTADRVMFDVEDECGGLPPGSVEELFRPFEQRGVDRSGVGLGLAICRRAAEANHGEIRVRDQPGKGCVFTLDLPRAPSD